MLSEEPSSTVGGDTVPRVTFTQSGNFNNTERFLNKMKNAEMYRELNRLGEQGVRALSAATPVRSGKTAASWDFETKISTSKAELIWTNSNVNNGVNVAIIIQYGHGTGTGGYVQGIDYINPAMRPVFESIADSVWKVVTSA